MQVLSRSRIGDSLSPTDWDCLLRDARRCALLPRLPHHLPATAAVPPPVRRQLQSGEKVGRFFERQLRWEIECLSRDLQEFAEPVVFLKGAAYLLTDLPIARGRHVNDIDILVDRQQLAKAEQVLRQHGWQPLPVSEYDDRYYRQWMHELPPLRHPQRKMALDLHHALLPPTGRVRPDTSQLLQAAQPISTSMLPDAKVLCPEDMYLHAAAHMFQDGELSGSLRDLLDLDGLYRHFSAADGRFPHRLIQRANVLQLQRPLHYALRYTRRLLLTPVDEEAAAMLSPLGPSWGSAWVMDRLVHRALIPPNQDGTPVKQRFAQFILYLRSHWLRMPPLLLARHLTRKLLSRLRS